MAPNSRGFGGRRRSLTSTSADGRFEILTSNEYARYIATLDARRPLATTFPRARLLALNDNPKLAAYAWRQPGTRVLSDGPTMTAIALPPTDR